MESFPAFFKNVPLIHTYDPLAKLLGSVQDGIIKFSYKQIVKITGHSCPTVAGAFLTCKRALEILYPDSLPVRGEIKVEFKEALEHGVTGVIANVISNITGATKEGGFKGLGGNFARHSLLEYEADINLHVKFTRLDTNKSIELTYNPNIVPPSQRLQELMQLVISKNASEGEMKEFGVLWQERVKRILIDNANNDRMIIFQEG